MNLLDRIRPLQLAMLAAGFFFSCESETSTFDFDLENNTRVRLIELELPSRSIYIDSLRTDNESRLITGNFVHDRLGTVAAEAYSEITYTEGRVIADTLRFDSLIINLTIENFLTNDPQFGASFTIHKLTEELEPSIVYLKDRQIDVRGAIDTLTFTLEPTADGERQNISFRADRWGRDIFSRISIDSVGQVISAVVDEVGLIPVPGNQTAVEINLDSDSTELVLYSSYDTLSFETRFEFTTNRYSYINHDRAGSEIDGLDNAAIFDFSDGNQMISSLFGVYNYLDLTPLKDFISSNESILINQAEINTSALSSSSEEIGNIRYYFHKQAYGFSGEGLFSNGLLNAILTNAAYLNGEPSILVSTFNEDVNRYDQDITFFMESYSNFYLDQGIYIADGLVVTPDDFVSLEESLLTSPSSTTLIIYATSVE